LRGVVAGQLIDFVRQVIVLVLCQTKDLLGFVDLCRQVALMNDLDS